jgi:hypothetical protein
MLKKTDEEILDKEMTKLVAGSKILSIQQFGGMDCKILLDDGSRLYFESEGQIDVRWIDGNTNAETERAKIRGLNKSLDQLKDEIKNREKIVELLEREAKEKPTTLRDLVHGKKPQPKEKPFLSGRDLLFHFSERAEQIADRLKVKATIVDNIAANEGCTSGILRFLEKNTVWSFELRTHPKTKQKTVYVIGREKKEEVNNE